MAKDEDEPDEVDEVGLFLSARWSARCSRRLALRSK
jgi:hypothetical protein